MPNFASLIRQEVRRLAKRESNAAVTPLRKQVASLRRRVAVQRRQIADLERAARTASAAAAARGPAAGAPAAGEPESRLRFSPAWMRKHRAKLGMSREAYAKLLGVSAQSVLVWEMGRTRPRPKAIEVWSRLRQMRVRDIKSGFAPTAGGEAAPRKRGGARRKPARRRGARRKPSRPARPARRKPSRRARPARRVRAARKRTRRAAGRKATSRRRAGRRRR